MLCINPSFQSDLEKNDVLSFVKQQNIRNMHSKDEQDLRLVRLDDATLFAGTGKEAKLSVMADIKAIKKFPFILLLTNVHLPPRQISLLVYSKIHDLVTHRKSINQTILIFCLVSLYLFGKHGIPQEAARQGT